jgi:hypothetical protein
MDDYTQVFGWRTQMLGPEIGNYVVVTTTGVDENPKKPGSINGGFFQKSNDKPLPHASGVRHEAGMDSVKVLALVPPQIILVDIRNHEIE